MHRACVAHCIISAVCLLASRASADLPEPPPLAAGSYTVQPRSTGALSLRYGGDVIVNYEMLQLIDNSEGWRPVFQYGRDTKVQALDSGARFAETVPGVMDCDKRVKLTPASVEWTLKWKASAAAGANWNYYFLDIPKAALDSAVFDLGYGEEHAQGVLTDVVPEKSGLTSAAFTTPRHRIRFKLAAAGVSWRLTDWTQSRHDSYRLRIEAPAENGVTAEISVGLEVLPSSPAAHQAALAALRKRDAQAREARALAWGLACAAPLRVGPLRANAAEIPRGARFELTFDLAATFDNPFDPRDVDVRCELRTPGRGLVTVPAFFYTPFERTADNRVGARGQPVWKVRFTPREAGDYTYRVKARDRTGEVESEPGSMRCTPGAYQGFVRVSPQRPFVFEFDSGAPYVPTGINLFYSTRLGRPPPEERLAECERLMNRLADAGGNFVRLRADSWFLAIEGTTDSAAGYLGPGWYQQQTCWEIDRLYRLAERRGMYIMHCLENANGLANLIGTPPPGYAWRRRYAFCLKDNGGPCDRVEDFWTNPEMLELTRRKLRYTVARWGASPRVMCWEFWNELVPRGDLMDQQVAWHRNMARYLRAIDPWRHPITSSMQRHFEQQAPMWDLPELEIVQVHTYRGRDLPTYMAEVIAESARRWRKPYFFGEFGIIHEDRSQGKYPYDPDGLHLHNGLWAPVMAGGAGPGAFWFVSGYLDKRDLYGHIRAFTQWAKSVPWNEPGMTRLEARDVVCTDPTAKPVYSDGPVVGKSKTPFKRAARDRFRVDPVSGAVEGAEHLQPHLHMSEERRKSTPTFILDCRGPATFVVRVLRSIGDETNRLQVSVDGEPAADRPFPAGREHGRAPEYVEQYENWRSNYNEEVAIPLPEGRREVRLEATGKDRLDVEYGIKNYFSFDPLIVTGLHKGDAAWFWVRNRLSKAYSLRNGVKIPPLRDLRVTLTGLEEGGYDVVWWDTWQGETVRSDRAACSNGELPVDIPPFTFDVAGSCVRRR